MTKSLDTLKTKTGMASLGYALFHLGQYLQGEITLSVALNAAMLALMALFGRAAIKKAERKR